MDSGQLTVTEMRILVTSVVHMNVDQIALSVITIPNLKVAVQRLLCVGRPETADRNPQYQISDNHYQRETTHINSAAELLSERTQPRSRPRNQADMISYHSDVSMSEQSSDHADATHSRAQDKLFKNKTSPQSQEIKQRAPSQDQPILSLEQLIPGSVQAGVTPQVKIVGNRLAIGKPKKSRAKTGKRVNYITCRICETIFYSRELYYDHMRTHANDPNVFTCRHCEFVTKRKYVYKTHLLRHSGARPFQCQHCTYACRQASLLQSHIARHHPEADKIQVEFYAGHEVSTPDQLQTKEEKMSGVCDDEITTLTHPDIM